MQTHARLQCIGEGVQRALPARLHGCADSGAALALWIQARSPHACCPSPLRTPSCTAGSTFSVKRLFRWYAYLNKDLWQARSLEEVVNGDGTNYFFDGGWWALRSYLCILCGRAGMAGAGRKPMGAKAPRGVSVGGVGGRGCCRWAA